MWNTCGFYACVCINMSSYLLCTVYSIGKINLHAIRGDLSFIVVLQSYDQFIHQAQNLFLIYDPPSDQFKQLNQLSFFPSKSHNTFSTQETKDKKTFSGFIPSSHLWYRRLGVEIETNPVWNGSWVQSIITV